jgi:hypothetical protein
MSRQIFISYRREKTPRLARSLRDRYTDLQTSAACSRSTKPDIIREQPVCGDIAAEMGFPNRTIAEYG